MEDDGRHCWASPLSDCGGGLSGEHLISENLFEGPRITVSGFPWLLGQTREIGLSSLTANILCRRHNSRLSDVDSAGGDAFRTLAEVVKRWREDRATATTRKPRTVKYEISGTMLERWFAKSAITLFCVLARPGMTWSIDGADPRTPPLSIVRFVFGDGELAPPLGLYGAHMLDPISPSSGVKVAPVFTDADGLAAMFFGLRDFRFVLWLHPEPPDLTLLEQAPDWRVGGVIRHPVAMEFSARGGVSRRLGFRWG